MFTGRIHENRKPTGSLHHNQIFEVLIEKNGYDIKSLIMMQKIRGLLAHQNCTCGQSTCRLRIDNSSTSQIFNSYYFLSAFLPNVPFALGVILRYNLIFWSLKVGQVCLKTVIQILQSYCSFYFMFWNSICRSCNKQVLRHVIVFYRPVHGVVEHIAISEGDLGLDF